MTEYWHYIREWASTGFIAPIMMAFLVAGPFLLLLPVLSSRAWLHVKMMLMVCCLAAYMFICIGTGTFLGKHYGHPFLGIVLAFAFCWCTFLAVAYVMKFIEAWRRRLERR